MQVVAQAKDILRSANEDYQKDSIASIQISACESLLRLTL
jgi:hypothetical protein